MNDGKMRNPQALELYKTENELIFYSANESGPFLLATSLGKREEVKDRYRYLIKLNSHGLLIVRASFGISLNDDREYSNVSDLTAELFEDGCMSSEGLVKLTQLTEGFHSISVEDVELLKILWPYHLISDIDTDHESFEEKRLNQKAYLKLLKSLSKRVVGNS